MCKKIIALLLTTILLFSFPIFSFAYSNNSNTKIVKDVSGELILSSVQNKGNLKSEVYIGYGYKLTKVTDMQSNEFDLYLSEYNSSYKVSNTNKIFQDYFFDYT